MLCPPSIIPTCSDARPPPCIHQEHDFRLMTAPLTLRLPFDLPRLTRGGRELPSVRRLLLRGFGKPKEFQIVRAISGRQTILLT